MPVEKPLGCGFRTYVFMSLMGAMSFAFGFAVGIVGFLFASGIALIAHFKIPQNIPVSPLEVALVMTFLIRLFVYGNPWSQPVPRLS